MFPIYAYYDRNIREDTGKINRMPKVNIFPFYQADSADDFKIHIHGK